MVVMVVVVVAAVVLAIPAIGVCFFEVKVVGGFVTETEVMAVMLLYGFEASVRLSGSFSVCYHY